MAFGSKLRAAALAAALAVASLPVVATTTAAAQTGDDVVETCRVALGDSGSRACSAAERLAWVAAQHCRRVPGADPSACPSIDGRDTSEAAVAGFEAGWTSRALSLQSVLDDEVPLTESLILHTHNSANSAAYAPSLTSNDANQVLTVTDQLRMGIRAIEFDAHWAPHPTGDPADGFRAPVQCHGQSPGTPAGAVHVGCSVDQLLVDLFTELRAWLDRPENGGEFVLLYLENQLEGSATAHDTTIEALETTLGDLLFRAEPGAGCQTLPYARSEAEILAAGAQVLVTGNCDPNGGVWNDVVFERGGPWNESGSTTDYLAGSDCDTERAAQSYETSFVRRYEDSTGLSLAVNGGSYISPDVAASLVRCGVNMPGLDQLHPDDERLPQFVWSWREGDRGDDPALACAAQGADVRFGALDCERSLPVACRGADGTWAVTETAVPWADGDLACVEEGHVAAGVPANGWDNQLLRRAAPAAAQDIWLAYGRDDGGRWVTEIPEPTLPDTGEDEPGNGPKDKAEKPGNGPKDKPKDKAKDKTKDTDGKGDRGNGRAARSVASPTEDGDAVATSRALPFGIGALGVLLAILVLAPAPRRRRS